MMFFRKRFLALILLCGGLFHGVLAEPASEVSQYQGRANTIVAEATKAEKGWQRLSTLCTLFPHRLSGTKGLEDAIDWIVSEMKTDGFDSVNTEAVMVPHWERGKERLLLLTDQPQEFGVLALGGSVSTPQEGVEAEFLVVSSYEELEQKKALAKGRIVVFDVPYVSYGETVGYRITGASRAADAGAVAALLRSITPHSLATPHTGVTIYADGSEKIPFGAISPEAAEHFRRLQDAHQKVRLKLTLETKTFTDAPSRNIVAEIKGSELPEEVIVLGGHIDGWDVGEGAQDDGGGCLMSWEALRLLSEMGLKPRRTIRVVLWTNEENGLRGAKTYRRLHDAEVPDHVLAIESDYGTFHPSGYNFTGKPEAVTTLRNIVDLLKSSVGEMVVKTPGGGADIGPLMEAGVPGAALTHKDERYFWYHHSAADTLNKIDPKDFRNCVATLAVTVFVVADMPTRLPFGSPEE